MDYDAFRSAWTDALRDANLLSYNDRAEEAVALDSMSRKHFVRVGMFQGGQPAEPFMGSMELSWEWNALKSARTRTNEGDVMAELLGRDTARDLKTELPALRIDITLHGKLSWDKPLLLAGPETWRAWVAEVASQVDPRLPPPKRPRYNKQGYEIIQSWLGEPEAQVRCGPMGELWLLGVELPAWQALDLPRKLDNPDKEDKSPGPQLKALAERVSAALTAWKKSLRMLLPEGAMLH
jgi:hypothetical protein